MSDVLALPLPWRTVTNDRRVSVLAANGLVVTEIFGTAFYQRKQEIADLIVSGANRGSRFMAPNEPGYYLCITGDVDH